MKKTIVTLICSVVALFGAAQNSDADLTNTLKLRAEKIVKTLELPDTSVSDKVVEIMVDQYKKLGTVHDNLKTMTDQVKNSPIEPDAKTLQITVLKNEASAKLYALHCSFIGSLSVYLTNDQVEKIKDGMTYGVVQVTYTSYIDMIPTMTQEEKQQLYAWLIEARERAMSAGSSNEKHEWFGKYKGRFNNYLSARGYDIKQERLGWQARLKEREKKS